MAEVRLTTPLGDDDVRKLQAGDWVFLNGLVFGVRDATLMRLFGHDHPCPVDLHGGILLHTAPNVRKIGDHYEPISIGTTTSTRMERFTPGLLQTFGVRAITGKGGLLGGSVQAMQEHGAVYLTIVGGAAAWETLHIEAIEAVYWEDLMPECLWQFRVRELGPLLVSIDSHGRSVYAEVKQEARDRLARLLEKPAPQE